MGCGASASETKGSDAVVPSTSPPSAPATPAPAPTSRFSCAMFSLDLGSEYEAQMREVYEILKEQGCDVLIRDAADDGEMIEKRLSKIKEEEGVLLAVCTSNYAAFDGRPHNTYFELDFAYENKVCVWPLRVENIYPPIPAWGTGRNSRDPSGNGPAIIAIAIGPKSDGVKMKCLDCRSQTAEEIAAAISKNLKRE
ncbi:unnamed protein product [Symbiodinium natans]|uniref:TIR domain-containing protein n=1 Tax=Symbiodinium natans TaxID=878477 RepID=A0A812RQC5_9DINO|nr:unnamed protein product [Symbiodinium natans]